MPPAHSYPFFPDKGPFRLNPVNESTKKAVSPESDEIVGVTELSGKEGRYPGIRYIPPSSSGLSLM